MSPDAVVVLSILVLLVTFALVIGAFITIYNITASKHDARKWEAYYAARAAKANVVPPNGDVYDSDKEE